jgi:hypothetical protein
MALNEFSRATIAKAPTHTTAPAPAAAAPSPTAAGVIHRNASGRIATMLTDARKEMLRELYPTYATPTEIMAKWNELPGKEMTDKDMISAYAQKLGLRRPADFLSKLYAGQQGKPGVAQPPVSQPWHTIQQMALRDGYDLQNREDLVGWNKSRIARGWPPLAIRAVKAAQA